MPISSEAYTPGAVYGTPLAAQIATAFDEAPSEGAGLPCVGAERSYWESTFEGPGEEDGVGAEGEIEGEVDVAIIG